MAYDIALFGLAVMGQNLVLNMVSRGYKVAVSNRTKDKIDEFVASVRDKKVGDIISGDHLTAEEKALVIDQDQLHGFHDLKELVANLERPRKVMLMIKAGPAVDAMIEQLIPLLEPGDVIIDGGNEFFENTIRRTKEVEDAGLLYIGTGVSGGEEGRLKGPSMMPGGSEKAWPLVKPIFQSIAAKVGPNNDIPCCDWVGQGGAGHYVKMVHNGIEYGDMQLISEAYFVMKHAIGLTNDDLYDVFAEWNKGELDSYLIEITRDIFSVKDPDTGDYLIDRILDAAGAKGTGKWMSQLALDLGVPSTLVTEAVYARSISALWDDRQRASKQLTGPDGVYEGDKKAFIEEVRQALYASKICSYAQGYFQLQAAAEEYGWDPGHGQIALLKRGGCIIRAQFLERIKDAFDADPKLENLLFAPYFKDAVIAAQPAWRHVVSTAIELGLPCPAFTTALTYFDSYRRSRLSANLLQAQRDYFSAHTYSRVDKEGIFHTEWLDLQTPAE